MTGPFTAPDRLRCPVCGTALAASRCGHCGADLAGGLGDELWRIDGELHRLSARRTVVVDGLLRHRAPAVEAPEPAAAAASAGPRPWAVAPQPAAAWSPPPYPGGRSPVVVAPAPGPDTSSLLLGLGTALLVVAALVFAAVSWSRIGAVGQGLLLVGLTGGVAFATDRAARRGLVGTAEALGVLTVVLGPLVAQAVRITADLPTVEDRSWSTWVSWTWWPAAIVVIGAAAIAFGRKVGVRSSQLLGTTLVQVGLPLWVVLSPVSPLVMGTVIAAQALVVLWLPAWIERGTARGSVWAAGGVAAGVAAGLLALGGSIGSDAGAHLGGSAALALTALVAAVVAHRWWAQRGPADVAAAAATAAGLAAVGRLAFGAVPMAAWWPLMGFVAAALLAAAPRLLGVRAEPVRAVAWCAAGVAAVPALDEVRAALVAAVPAVGAWRGAAGDVHPLDQGWEASRRLGAVVAGTLALVAAGAAALVPSGEAWRSAAVRRRVAVLGATAAAVLAVTVPALAGATVAAMALTCLGVALALAAAAWRVEDRMVLPMAALAALALAGAWASATAPLTLVAVAVAVVLGGAAVADALRPGREAWAGPGAALATLGLAAEAGLVPAALGAAPTWSWASVAVVAAGLGAALSVVLPGDLFARAEPTPVLDPSLPPPPTAAAAGSWGPAGVAAAVAGALLAILHGFALLSSGTVADGVDHGAPLTVALAAGAACLMVVGGARRDRSSAWFGWSLAGGGELVALAWLRLAGADVTLVEAYTAPLVLLVAAAVVLAADKGPGWPARTPSWQLEGPVLALGLLPTALLALGDPGLTRQAIGLGAGALLLGFGVATRRRAPVDVGAVAVAAIGLQALAPYAAEVPRWISLGLAGTLLVVLGATFEQRRRDLHEARRRYASLR